jgi:hypothetical protein
MVSAAVHRLAGSFGRKVVEGAGNARPDMQDDADSEAREWMTRITAPGLALEVRHGHKGDAGAEYVMLALAGAPNLAQAIEHLSWQLLTNPWAVGAHLPWLAARVPMPPLAYAAWPVTAWLEICRLWADAWATGLAPANDASGNAPTPRVRIGKPG